MKWRAWLVSGGLVLLFWLRAWELQRAPAGSGGTAGAARRGTIWTVDGKVLAVSGPVEGETQCPAFGRGPVRRWYPLGRVAGVLVGRPGVIGLERILERYLEQGWDVVLAMDAIVQREAERLLEEALQESGARGGALVVLDLRKGEWRALASVPRICGGAVDWTAYEWVPWRWRLEPGSTVKPLALAIALQEGLWDEEQVLVCRGSFRVADHTIREFENRKHHQISTREILVYSCNIGAAQVGLRIPGDLWAAWLEQWGFGEQGIQEPPGLAFPRWEVREPPSIVDRATWAFGQGFQVTPLQLVRAYSVIALDGTLLRPCLVVQVLAAGRTRWRCRPEREVGLLEPRIARWLREAMVEVVERGTGRAAALKGWRVAGKTGTAQKVVREGGRALYSQEKSVVSFVGMVPAEEPLYLVGVFLDEPADPRASGGRWAAPVFRQMAEWLLWYQ